MDTNKFELSKKSKIKIFTLTGILVALTLLGASYAYFSLQVIGNEEASSMYMEADNLVIKYTDGSNLNISGIYPNTTMTKTFSVKNESSTRSKSITNIYRYWCYL